MILTIVSRQITERWYAFWWRTLAHSDSKHSKIQSLSSTLRRRQQILIRSFTLCLRTSKSRNSFQNVINTVITFWTYSTKNPRHQVHLFLDSLPALQRELSSTRRPSPSDFVLEYNVGLSRQPTNSGYVRAFQGRVLTSVIPSLYAAPCVGIPLSWTEDTSDIFSRAVFHWTETRHPQHIESSSIVWRRVQVQDRFRSDVNSDFLTDTSDDVSNTTRVSVGVLPSRSKHDDAQRHESDKNTSQERQTQTTSDQFLKRLWIDPSHYVWRIWNEDHVCVWVALRSQSTRSTAVSDAINVWSRTWLSTLIDVSCCHSYRDIPTQSHRDPLDVIVFHASTLPEIVIESFSILYHKVDHLVSYIIHSFACIFNSYQFSHVTDQLPDFPSSILHQYLDKDIAFATFPYFINQLQFPS